jgi:NADPH:quinone reductase-like Zn-dependent oxidoreductase
MKAAIVPQYGTPNVIQIEDRPIPKLASKQVLVQIYASVVTTGDWRLRAAAYPRGLKLVGRMVSGIFKPRHEIPGITYSGIVVAAGSEVTRFAKGDFVFGVANKGGHAEYIAVAEDSAIAVKPVEIDFAQAATLPFGAATAYHFLKRMARVQPGEKVLVTGASGGVGHLAVQMAKALGADVTGVASARNDAFVKDLGADHTVAYETMDLLSQGPVYDVVFDTIGLLDFAKARKILGKRGRFLVAEGAWREVFQMMVPWRRNGHRLKFSVSEPDATELEELAAMAKDGLLRPVIEAHFSLDEIAEAHRAVETRRRRGVIALDIRDQKLSSVAA